MIQSEELHSIGQAATLSGVPVETIRIWERRYQAVQPVRTLGGHRKYTTVDIQYLASLKAMVDRGTRIGKAAKLPREEVLSGVHAPQQDKALQSEYRDLTAKILNAARDLNNEEVAALLKIEEGQVALDVVTGCFLPLLKEVGVLWHAGEISVAVEHMVENAVSSEIQSVIRTLPSSSDGPIAVCAALEGDRHEVGLLTASLFLQQAGVRTVYLGGDLPLSDLDDAVRRVRPDIIILSAMLAPQKEHLEHLEEMAKKTHFRRAARVIGGSGIIDRAQLPSFEHCATLGDFSRLIPQLIEEFVH